MFPLFYAFSNFLNITVIILFKFCSSSSIPLLSYCCLRLILSSSLDVQNRKDWNLTQGVRINRYSNPTLLQKAFKVYSYFGSLTTSDLKSILAYMIAIQSIMIYWAPTICEALCWVWGLQRLWRQARCLSLASICKCNFFIISVHCFRVDTGKKTSVQACFFRWSNPGSPPSSPLHTRQGTHNPHLYFIPGIWYPRISCPNDEILGPEWPQSSYTLEV